MCFNNKNKLHLYKGPRLSLDTRDSLFNGANLVSYFTHFKSRETVFASEYTSIYTTVYEEHVLQKRNEKKLIV